MVSFDKPVSLIFRMIPALLVAVATAGCENEKSSQVAQVTVEQRRVAINSTMEHLNAGRINEALAIVSTLVSKDSTSSQTQETHGTILLASSLNYDKIGNVEKAAKLRQQALNAYVSACEYSSSPGLLQLSTAQLAQSIHKTEVANKYYRLAHASNPTDGRPAFFLAQMYLLNKNWVQAKHWASESLSRDPNEPFTLLSASLVEAELGNLDEAKKLSTRGCEILPNDSNIRLMQARVVRICGNPVQALEILSSLPETMKEINIVQEERTLCLTQIESSEQ